MPGRLQEVIDLLGRSTIPGRARTASYLLDASGDYRQKLADEIDAQLARNQPGRRPQPIWTTGAGALALFVWSPSLPRDETLLIEHTKAAMALAGESRRLVVELTYDSSSELSNVRFRDILLELNEGRTPSITRAARELQHQRVDRAAKMGKAGRNDQCPCGSGLKFKKCCGR